MIAKKTLLCNTRRQLRWPDQILERSARKHISEVEEEGGPDENQKGQINSLSRAGMVKNDPAQGSCAENVPAPEIMPVPKGEIRSRYVNDGRRRGEVKMGGLGGCHDEALFAQEKERNIEGDRNLGDMREE